MTTPHPLTANTLLSTDRQGVVVLVAAVVSTCSLLCIMLVVVWCRKSKINSPSNLPLAPEPALLLNSAGSNTSGPSLAQVRNSDFARSTVAL